MYKKPLIFVADDLAEGVYADSGMTVQQVKEIITGESNTANLGSTIVSTSLVRDSFSYTDFPDNSDPIRVEEPIVPAGPGGGNPNDITNPDVDFVGADDHASEVAENVPDNTDDMVGTVDNDTGSGYDSTVDNDTGSDYENTVDNDTDSGYESTVDNDADSGYDSTVDNDTDSDYDNTVHDDTDSSTDNAQSNTEDKESTSEGGGNTSDGTDCYTVSAEIIQWPEVGRDTYTIKVKAMHAGDHNSNAQCLEISFTQPVTYVDCKSGDASLVSGDGSPTLLIKFAYWNNHTDNIELSDLSVQSTPGLAIIAAKMYDIGMC